MGLLLLTIIFSCWARTLDPFSHFRRGSSAIWNQLLLKILFQLIFLILIVIIGIWRKNVVVYDIVVVKGIMQTVHFENLVTPAALEEIQ